MGIFYGLLAAFTWGVGDIFAARLSRLASTRRAPLFTQSLGVLVSAVIVVFGGSGLPNAAPLSCFWVAALGMAHALATILFYRALEVGKVSLTTPIISAFAVVTAVLAFFSGERPTRLALAGAMLAIIGLVIMTALHKGEHGEANLEAELGDNAPHNPGKNGVPQAIGSALFFGITFWGVDMLEPTFGGAWLVLMLRVVTVPILGALFYLTRNNQQNKPLAPATIPVVLACAVTVIACDTIAWMSIAKGRQVEDVAIVTTLASLYSAVTIFLAWLFWRERLEKLQWLGIAAILLGVVLVGIA